MAEPMRALELSGRIDEDGRLQLEERLSSISPGRVRVILLIPEDEDISEREWLRAATSNSAFDFLKDPQEDIYTLADGKPFNVEG